MRHLTGATVFLFLLVLLCFGAGCKRGKESGELPNIQVVRLPTQSPVPLQVATVDKFVDWVSTMPSSQIDDVKKQIALVKNDPKIVDAVASRLSFNNLGSYGRQLIYLSILGEMKNERAVGPLQDYLNSHDCPVFEERINLREPAPGASDEPRTSLFDSCAGLKTHAVNMIAYVNSAAAQRAVLNAISEHASRSVRLGAMNAYLYNNGDSEQAIAAVRRRARPEELKFIGLPRLSPETSAKDFADRMERFYTANPDERPPLPTRVVGNRHNARPPRRSVEPSVGSGKGGSR